MHGSTYEILSEWDPGPTYLVQRLWDPGGPNDMWTTGTMDNALGSSLQLITKDFDVIHLAVGLIKNNILHASHNNALMVDDVYQEQCFVAIATDAEFMTSDTTSAAKAVSSHFDDLIQVNCELYVVNLILEDGIGMCDNTKIDKTTGNQVICTPGGALPLG